MLKIIIFTLLILVTGCSEKTETLELRIGNHMEILNSQDLKETQREILKRVKDIWVNLKDGEYSEEFVVQKTKITETEDYIETKTSLTITFKLGKQIDGIDGCYQVNFDKSLTELFFSKKLEWRTIESVLKYKDYLSTEKLASLTSEEDY